MKAEELEKLAVENVERAKNIAAQAGELIRQHQAKTGQIGGAAQLDIPSQVLIANAVSSAISTLAQVRQYRTLDAAVKVAGAFANGK